MVRDLGPFISSYILLSNLLKRSEDANMNSVKFSGTVRGSGRNVTVFMLRNRSASRQKGSKPEAVYDRPKISASTELLELHTQCTPWQRHPPQLRPKLPNSSPGENGIPHHGIWRFKTCSRDPVAGWHWRPKPRIRTTSSGRLPHSPILLEQQNKKRSMTNKNRQTALQNLRARAYTWSAANDNDPAQTGYDPEAPWTNIYNILRGRMTPAGQHYFREDKYIQNEARDCKNCDEWRDWCFKYSPTVIFLKEYRGVERGS
jgi:hypothetical protein